MRFNVGDIVRVKKGHRARKDLPNSYKIASLGSGPDNNPNYARIKLAGDDRWLFRESTLRLVRRAL